MTDPKKSPDRDPAQAEELKTQELKDETLDRVTGGVARRGGDDDDLEELEVQR